MRLIPRYRWELKGRMAAKGTMIVDRLRDSCTLKNQIETVSNITCGHQARQGAAGVFPSPYCDEKGKDNRCSSSGRGDWTSSTLISIFGTMAG